LEIQKVLPSYQDAIECFSFHGVNTLSLQQEDITGEQPEILKKHPDID